MQQPITFLLIDDDMDDTFLFEEVLRDVNSSFTFQSALNGLQAWEQLNAAGSIVPDLIFLDLNMPKMNGKEFLQLIKNDNRLKQVPVIMYTTSSHSKDIEETMQLGAVCFITKPSNVKDLKYILSQLGAHVHTNLPDVFKRLSDSTSTFIVY